MKRVTWIFSMLVICLLFIGCASFFNPGADDPDSPGGKKITKKEKQQAIKNAKSAGSSLSALLAALGLGPIAAGAGVATSVGANIYQLVSGKQYKEAAKRYSKTINKIWSAAKDLDLSESEVDSLILQALEDSGAREGEAKRVYRYFKKNGDI